MQDLKLYLAKILEIACKEVTGIKNLARSSQDFVGIYVQDLGKILRSYRILPKFFLKYDITRSCTKSYTRS